jgi:hypothetical protein
MRSPLLAQRETSRYTRAMISRLLALFAALFLLSFAASATAAAVSCPEAPLSISAVTSMADDCAGHHSKKSERTVACTAMCAAIAPKLAPVAAPPIAAASALPLPQTELTGRNARPDPPPPRG